MCLLVTPHGFTAPKTEDYEQAVVRILNFGIDKRDKKEKGRTGSGFFVNSAGHVLTNHHVIDDSDWEGGARLSVVYSGKGESEPATLVWADRELDLAVILVQGAKAPAVLKMEKPLVEKGVSVYAIGYPGVQDKVSSDNTMMLESTISPGGIANREQRKWYPHYSRKLWVLGHTADIHRGNSGGPLINDCNHVVGVNTQVGYDMVDEKRGEVIGAYKYASHISEAISVLSAQNIAMNVVSEVCDPAPAEELNAMSFLNTGAIILLAGLLALMFFKQSRQAVVQGVQKSIVKISSIGGSAEEASRSRPKPGGGMPLSRAAPRPARPAGSSASGRLQLVPQNSAAAGMNYDLAVDWLSQQKHGVSFGREARIVDHVIQGEGVSRRHFRVSFEQGNYFAEDLNSASGTEVNGTRLKPYYADGLKDGDTITAGACQWRVHLT